MTVAQQSAISAALAHWFGLTRGASDVLTRLYLTRQPIGPLALAALTDYGAATIVRVHLPSLRAALCDDALDRVPPAGYILTEAGRAECRDALARVRDELGAAA